MIKETNLYNYKGNVIRLIDADTVLVDIQLGFYLTYQTKIRLLGINAPEKNTKEGKKAIEWLEKTLPLNQEITLEVYKAPEKYGRWLAYITYNGLNINQELIKSGNAVEYYGGKRE